MSGGERPYLMSFGVGGLHINESVAVARLHEPGEDWNDTLARAHDGGAFQVRKLSSSRRSLREITNRLRFLEPAELDLLVAGDRAEQAALLWLAACRAYRFIAEFASEVVADRYLTMRTDLTYDDYDAFFSAKAQWSDKLESLSDTTRAKLRAVLFRLMREADIINRNDAIVGAVLSPRLLGLLLDGHRDELRYFPGGERLARGR